MTLGIDRWAVRFLVLVCLGAGGTCARGDTPAPATLDASVQRQDEIAKRGALVMPFSLASTLHVFTQTPDGGIQRVVVREAGDARQIELIRQHLRQMQARFARGDFSGPERIHGHDMPGLAQLEAAKPGQLRIAYQEVAGGAQLDYVTGDARLIGAVHAWFDAQVSDHGADAMVGHSSLSHNPSAAR